ncbi:glutamate--tRNA ligase [Ureaplasma ceti]
MISIDKKDQKIRTRYAPSPTGFFHIGGARTAIFNYLFAKHYGGDFIVRIEDTDVERNVEGGIESQLDNLAWLGIVPDESVNNPGNYAPYIQSAKLGRYKELAEKLLAEGKAYYCFCSEEQLEQDREEALKNHQTPRYSKRCLHLSHDEVEANLKSGIPHVIRLKIDDNREYAWKDLIRDDIAVPGSAMTDPVILKSNGIAMYNFAVVVDDYDMEISHVLRGEEHISNTPYQIAIKEALGFDKQPIQYGHLSVIIDETGKKLSKRNKTLKQFVSDYKEMGFVPEAIVNFLALLGWSPANNEEVMKIDDLIAEFDIVNLSKSSTFFDFKKLLWIGNEYMKRMDAEQYLAFVKPWVLNNENANLSDQLKDNLDMVLMLFKDQISYADEINKLIQEYFGLKELELSDEMKEILIANKDAVMAFRDALSEASEYTEDSIKAIINEVKATTGKKGKNLFMPVRVAATWMMHGPELAKIIFLTGKDNVLENIDQVLYIIQE